jgi:hypothetical protein
MSDAPAEARLRGHHLLCLLSFSGEGYSDAFVARFQELATLYRNPDSLVEVLASPDDACAACPHIGPAGCLSPVDGPEAAVRELDRTVLTLLGIEPGTWRAGELHARLNGVEDAALHQACSRCSWYGKTECQRIIREWVSQNA